MQVQVAGAYTRVPLVPLWSPGAFKILEFWALGELRHRKASRERWCTRKLEGRSIFSGCKLLDLLGMPPKLAQLGITLMGELKCANHEGVCCTNQPRSSARNN